MLAGRVKFKESNIMERFVVVPEGLFEKLANYLAEQPFNEVNNLFGAFQNLTVLDKDSLEAAVGASDESEEFESD